MGIKNLMKLIQDQAPNAVKEGTMESHFGRKIAIDASMSLYQFLIAVRAGPEAQNLTNEAGDVTSHITGFFYRTIKMLESGIKPIFVFDGKPPELKKGEIAKRKEKREEAKAELAKAEDNENRDDINKFQKRLVKVTSEHNDDIKKLLRLLGVPVIEAPGEAEAQCAAMAKNDLVYATATEDMDALTFGSPKLLRYLTFNAQAKKPILEIDLSKVLEGLKLSMEQFIDLCILCGCDYTCNIKGIGPHKAYNLIKDYKSIEKALKHIDSKKFDIPSDFLYKEAAKLFTDPEVSTLEEIKQQLVWREADEEGVKKFLVEEKQFNLDRVVKGLQRLKKAKGKGSQQRMDNFFKMGGGAAAKSASASSSSSSSAASSASSSSSSSAKKSASTAAATKKDDKKSTTKPSASPSASSSSAKSSIVKPSTSAAATSSTSATSKAAKEEADSDMIDTVEGSQSDASSSSQSNKRKQPSDSDSTASSTSALTSSDESPAKKLKTDSLDSSPIDGSTKPSAAASPAPSSSSSSAPSSSSSSSSVKSSPAKKAKPTAKQKEMANAAKNTKSLASMFAGAKKATSVTSTANTVNGTAATTASSTSASSPPPATSSNIVDLMDAKKDS